MILKNAVQAIQVGVEDYQEGSQERLLSAVRNIHAGILLLHKEVLARLSPPGSEEVLIKARVIPQRDAAGGIVFVGKGKKTIDTQQILERFEALGLSIDRKGLKALGDLRNDVEHYYTNVTQGGLQGTISSAMTIVSKVVTDHLGGNPRDLLGAETWQAMLDVDEVYAKEREASLEALQSVAWGSAALGKAVVELHCPHCSSDILIPEPPGSQEPESVRCRSCSYEWMAEDFIPSAITSYLAGSLYETVKSGGIEPYCECPTCNAMAFVLDEGQCAHCGEVASTECSMCGTSLMPEEISLGSSRCSYCERL